MFSIVLIELKQTIYSYLEDSRVPDLRNKVTNQACDKNQVEWRRDIFRVLYNIIAFIAWFNDRTFK